MVTDSNMACAVSRSFQSLSSKTRRPLQVLRRNDIARFFVAVVEMTFAPLNDGVTVAVCDQQVLPCSATTVTFMAFSSIIFKLGGAGGNGLWDF